MRFINYFIAFSLAIFIISCANEQGITGGLKDITPPKLLNTIPSKNQRTNFSGNKLIFEFNEFIKVQGFTNEVKITPSIEGVTHNINRNELTISFAKPLEENTTYTINFGSAIRDITENNIKKNLIFAFSTGPQLDSLTIQGEVKDWNSNKLESDILLGLYDADDTLTIENGKPKYYTYTNSLGKFKFNYLKKGDYKLYALKDKNKNLQYNKGEKIDFLSKKIELDTVIPFFNFKLFTESHHKNKIISIKQIQNRIELKLKKGVKQITSSNKKWIISDKGEILQFFPLQPKVGNKLDFQLSIEDSLGRKIDTTFQIIYKDIPVRKQKLLKKIKPDLKEYIKYNFEAQASFNTPIHIPKDSALELSTGKKSFPLLKSHLKLKNGDSELIIHNKQVKSDSVWLIIHNKSILSTIDSNKFVEKDSILFIKKNQETLSIVKGSIKTKYSHFTIQLMDQSQKVVREAHTSHFSFTHVKPGKYYFRVLIDENKDGYHEKGSYLNKVSPEKIFFKEGEILLKANWEINDVILEF